MKNKSNEVLAILVISLAVVLLVLVADFVLLNEKANINNYLYIILVFIVVILIVTIVTNKFLLKGDDVSGILNLIEIGNEISNTLVIVYLYFNLDAQEIIHHEKIFLTILCIKIFYIAFRVQETKAYKYIDNKISEVVGSD